MTQKVMTSADEAGDAKNVLKIFVVRLQARF
jgi:hypothetical protein